MGCQAQQYFYKEAEERGMSPAELEREWIYDCWGSLGHYVHGFIFRDGSIIEIGIYEDHRVISMEDWLELNLVTYTLLHGECDFRVNGFLTYAQAEMMVRMCEISGASTMYVDVYDEDDNFKGSIRFDGIIPSPEGLKSRVFAEMYR